MRKFQFIKIDSVLAKFKKDFKGINIEETDAIEWIGEALGFIKLVSASEEAIQFIEVKNYQAPIPTGLHYIIQIAKNNNWQTPAHSEDCILETKQILSIPIELSNVNDCDECEQESSNLVPVNCNGELMGDYEVAYYRPFHDYKYFYRDWRNNYKSKYTPVRLADHTFFDTLVCKEENWDNLYCRDCDTDEYTIVQDNLRFNFKEGFIAIAYVRQMIDEETGYPMIPDDEYIKSAITYYMIWKIKESECFMHREGSCQLADRARANWESYIKKFKNKAKMPTGIDEHQNLLEQSLYLIPNVKKYYGFFGNLSKMENLAFKNRR